MKWLHYDTQISNRQLSSDIDISHAQLRHICANFPTCSPDASVCHGWADHEFTCTECLLPTTIRRLYAIMICDASIGHFSLADIIGRSLAECIGISGRTVPAQWVVLSNQPELEDVDGDDFGAHSPTFKLVAHSRSTTSARRRGQRYQATAPSSRLGDARLGQA